MTATADRPSTNGVAVAADAPRNGAGLSPTRGGAPLVPPSIDRLDTIWRGKRWILLAAVVAAVLTLVATALVPKTFSSSIQVGLNASPVSGSSVADLAVASNNLAAQYAQVVTSEAVLQPAAAASGTTSTELSSHTTASTLASQNIVIITVQAARADQAQARAGALGASLVDYVAQQGTAASKQYSDSVTTQLAPLDAQISRVSTTVDAIGASLAKTDKKTAPQTVSASSARLTSAQSLLTALTDRRSNLISQAALQAIGLAPRSQTLGSASAAVQVEPRPLLYTLVAAVLGLVIGTQVVLTAAERRQRRRGQVRA